MVTSASAWKKSNTAEMDLTVPSGNVCKVRRLKPEAFLDSGLMPDTLSDMVTKAIKSKKGLPPDAVAKMSNDPKQLMKGLQMMDQVLCYVVIEPDVQMPPSCGIPVGVPPEPCGQYETDEIHTESEHDNYHTCMLDDRDEDTLYADEVSLEDKTFIFQFALGGVADVQRFREEQGAAVANLSNGKAVSGKTKRTSKRK